MAHSEMEEREQRLQQVEGLSNSIRLELLSSDTERRHLRDTLGQQGIEIQQVRINASWIILATNTPDSGGINIPLILMLSKHLQALQAYEAQVSSLVRGTSRLEEELHKAQEEKAVLLSDLASVRELCVKLDSGKELTLRQLTSKSMDLERVSPAAYFCLQLLSITEYLGFFCKHMHVFRSQENWKMFSQRRSY